METDRDAGGAQLLYVDNEDHMWALNFIYESRINRSLEEFQNQWNNHGLRTEGHSTPTQIFVRDTLGKCNTSLTAISDIMNTRRLGEGGDIPEIPPINPAIAVPGIRCPLSENNLQLLRLQVDPLADDGAMGMEAYKTTLRFIVDNV
jgi:hypothetical protein